MVVELAEGVIPSPVPASLGVFTFTAQELFDDLHLELAHHVGVLVSSVKV